jgi:nuclear pore complex protein Nup155
MQLPDFILRQIDDAESKCFMGLFPTIDRLWLSIDHRLFLWDYKTGYAGLADYLFI